MEKLTKLKHNLLNPNQEGFNSQVSIRLYNHQLGIIDRIITHARSEEGEKKYISRVHFARAAIMQLILKELHGMDIRQRKR